MHLAGSGPLQSRCIPRIRHRNRAALQAPKQVDQKHQLYRRSEERLIELCANGDFRLSRWLRAGDTRTLAGVAAILASVEGFDRPRMLALAERLSPGMSSPHGFNQWLGGASVQVGRFVSMLRTRIAGSRKTSGVNRT